ncbi:MAG: hypothetical protein M5R36_02520 [Deltaproteobacteria bacterium]|nr:hypothetical protein [Deltaproteobacteria bacterium]
MAGATVAPEWRDHERRVFYRNVLYVGAVAAWAALVYHGSLKARFFLDDYLHLHLVERIDNLLVPFARDLMMGAFYRPGVFPFWKLNFMLAGLHPAWYYAFNLAVLAGSCLLLMQAMQHLTGNKGVSAFSTLLFAVSPITAIGLLWLSNRFDLYATFFFLLSLVLFLRYLRFRRTWDISISVAAGTYAFFCKEIAVTLPAVLLLSGLFMFHYRGRDPKLTRAETPRIFLLSLP